MLYLSIKYLKPYLKDGRSSRPSIYFRPSVYTLCCPSRSPPIITPNLSRRGRGVSARGAAGHALSSRAAAEQVQRLRLRPLRAQAAAQPVQGLRRQRHLRPWSAAQPMQGLRRQQHLRARAAAQPVQGVWRWRHLRARASARRMQGLRRQQHLRARAAVQPVQRVQWRQRSRDYPRGDSGRGIRRGGSAPRVNPDGASTPCRGC